MDTGEDLPEAIEWSKFSGAAWLPDTSGFFYARYDAPQEGEELQGTNYFHKLYFHRLGTPQSADELVFERPDQKEWGFSPQVSDDGRYLVLQVFQGTDVRHRIFYHDLQGGGFVELIAELEAAYTFVGNDGPVFYFRTDLDAPRGRLVAIDTAHPAKANWRTLIPEGPTRARFGQNGPTTSSWPSSTADAHHEIWRFSSGRKTAWGDCLAGLGNGGHEF